MQNNTHLFTLDGTNKNASIMDLVKFHYTSGIPVNKDVKLLRAIRRKPWELNGDRVKMVKKVGAGAYGEVWQGTMTEGQETIDVAIKVKK